MKTEKYNIVVFDNFAEGYSESLNRIEEMVEKPIYTYLGDINNDNKDDFEIIIEKRPIEFFKVGHQFVPFTITVPENATPGDVFSRDILVSARNRFLDFLQRWIGIPIFEETIHIQVEIVAPEDDYADKLRFSHL